jgi:hypothetical protein
MVGIKSRSDVLFHIDLIGTSKVAPRRLDLFNTQMTGCAIESKHGYDYEQYRRTVFICEEKRCRGVKVDEWKSVSDVEESEGQSRQLNKYRSAKTNGIRCGMLVDLRSTVAAPPRKTQHDNYRISSNRLAEATRFFENSDSGKLKGEQSLVDSTLGYII